MESRSVDVDDLETKLISAGLLDSAEASEQDRDQAAQAVAANLLGKASRALCAGDTGHVQILVERALALPYPESDGAVTAALVALGMVVDEISALFDLVTSPEGRSMAIGSLLIHLPAGPRSIVVLALAGLAEACEVDECTQAVIARQLVGLDMAAEPFRETLPPTDQVGYVLDALAAYLAVIALADARYSPAPGATL